MDFSRTTYLDDTAATLIGKVIEGKPVVVSGLHGEPAKMLASFGTLQPDRSAQDVEQAKGLIREMVTRLRVVRSAVVWLEEALDRMLVNRGYIIEE